MRGACHAEKDLLARVPLQVRPFAVTERCSILLLVWKVEHVSRKTRRNRVSPEGLLKYIGRHTMHGAAPYLLSQVEVS